MGRKEKRHKLLGVAAGSGGGAKAQKAASSSSKAEVQKKGCNTPMVCGGCQIGEEIPAGAKNLPPGAVRVVCENDNCPKVPYLHAKCTEKWEKYLINIIQRQNSRARDWSRHFIEKQLWTHHCRDLIHDFCECECGATLRRDTADTDAPAMAVAAPAAAQNQAHRKPPKNQNRATSNNMAASSQAEQHTSKPPKLNPGYMGNLHKAVPGYAATPVAGRPLLKDRPKIQRDIASASDEQNKAPKKHSLSAYIPVGMAGWKGSDEEQATNVPPLRRNVGIPPPIISGQPPPSTRWPTLPRSATAASNESDLSGEQACASIGGYSGAASGAMSASVVQPSEMDVQRLVGDLEKLVATLESIRIDDELVGGALGTASAAVNMQIVDMGGLAGWLAQRSSLITVNSNGMIVCRANRRMPKTIQKALGSVTKVLNIGGDRAILHCEQYQCNVYVDGTQTVSFENCDFLLPGDFVRFRAEQLDCSVHECNWVATDVELLQRMEVPPEASETSDDELANGSQRSFVSDNRADVVHSANTTGDEFQPATYQRSHPATTGVTNGGFDWKSFGDHVLMPPPSAVSKPNEPAAVKPMYFAPVDDFDDVESDRGTSVSARSTPMMAFGNAGRGRARPLDVTEQRKPPATTVFTGAMQQLGSNHAIFAQQSAACSSPDARTTPGTTPSAGELPSVNDSGRSSEQQVVPEQAFTTAADADWKQSSVAESESPGVPLLHSVNATPSPQAAVSSDYEKTTHELELIFQCLKQNNIL